MTFNKVEDHPIQSLESHIHHLHSINTPFGNGDSIQEIKAPLMDG